MDWNDFKDIGAVGGIFGFVASVGAFVFQGRSTAKKVEAIETQHKKDIDAMYSIMFSNGQPTFLPRVECPVNQARCREAVRADIDRICRSVESIDTKVDILSDKLNILFGSFSQFMEDYKRRKGE